MNPVLTFDGRKFALRCELSHAQLADLLMILENAQPVEDRWTPDYAIRGLVPSQLTPMTVGIELVPSQRCYTLERWTDECVNHPKKEVE